MQTIINIYYLKIIKFPHILFLSIPMPPFSHTQKSAALLFFMID